MNFWPDFIKLKTSVGGNREQHGYEETFGQPREEQQHITVPAPHLRRILSQMGLTQTFFFQLGKDLILKIMNIEQPTEMTGVSIVE